MSRRLGIAFFILTSLFGGATAWSDNFAEVNSSSHVAGAQTVHAISRMDAPKYEFGFEHFKYVNPNAPKGGTIRFGVSRVQNQNILPASTKGNSVVGNGNLFDTLLTAPSDDPYSSYGKLARSMVLANDCSYVIFNLDERAKFNDPKNDGCDKSKPPNRQQVTAEDVAFSITSQKESGSYGSGTSLLGLKSVEVVSANQVMVRLEPKDCKRTIANVGSIPIVSKKYFKDHDLDFSKSTLVPPPGSGPYVVKQMNGTSISYKRVCNWWGENLPVNKGIYNFDHLEYQSYFDDHSKREAFKKNEIDFYYEGRPDLFPAKAAHDSNLRDQIKNKEITAHEFTLYGADNIWSLAINAENPALKDRNVRKALSEVFPHEYLAKVEHAQKEEALDTYLVQSYFPHLSPDPQEDSEAREILKGLQKKYGSKFPDEALDPPTARRIEGIDYAAMTRARIKRAREYMQKAGWKLELDPKDPNQAVWMKDGKRFPELDFPVATTYFNHAYAQDLRKLGIKVKPRKVDTWDRLEGVQKEGNYDISNLRIFHHDIPSTDMTAYWKTQDTKDWDKITNLTRTKSPVIDELLDKAMKAKSVTQQRAALKALDSVLQAENPTVLTFQEIRRRIYVNNRFGRGYTLPTKGHVDLWGISELTWWETKPVD